ncbi:hypothetical protein LEMLEM_LOCUS3948 [Lemmus lemmus]
MIRIFPDFSVQVTAAAAGGAAAGVPAGAGMGRAGASANGTPQNVQGITSYQQRKMFSVSLPVRIRADGQQGKQLIIGG